jgi:hypothetical protein
MPENLGLIGKLRIRKTIDALQRATHFCTEVASREVDILRLDSDLSAPAHARPFQDGAK